MRLENRLEVRLGVFLAMGGLVASACSGLGATHYVNLSSTNATAPYTNWATAATVIQDAVDAAALGDEIVVTNGLYATGGRAVRTHLLVNRVAVDKPLTLRSVNGPQFTVIQGYQVPGITNGDGAIRCVYLVSDANMSGFTLTNGATRINGAYLLEQSGGGVWCESAAASVSNCVIMGNSAQFGGGSSGGTLNNCTLTGNSAFEGGGVVHSTLNNCTLTGNSGQFGGGAASSTLNNCRLTANLAQDEGGGVYGGDFDTSSTLNNCTLTGNSAYWGGGAFESSLNNCTLTANLAQYGGGASGGTLNNCALRGNSAGGDGGGVFIGTLNNCTLTGNSAGGSGGGVGGSYGCGDFGCFTSAAVLNNCIVYFNSAQVGPNFGSYSRLNYCCTAPLPTNGVGNISLDPQLASASHLSAPSPCIGRGDFEGVTGVDIDGEAWANPPSIGCDEYHIGAVIGPLTVSIVAAFTNVAAGFAVEFTALTEGPTSASVWDFGDGLLITNRPFTSHSWTNPGDYAVVLRAYNDNHPGGVSAVLTIHVVAAPIHYVAANGGNPVSPYTSWTTAATNIQDAVDATTVPGALVLVTNGTYATVVVNKPLALKSVNGPQATVIDGSGLTRCVYLGAKTTLSGFTLTNGWSDDSGGGVWCESANAVVSNCTMSGNSALYDGGGVSGGTLNNCKLSGNASDNDGGGVSGAALNNCSLSGNWAYGSGGGASQSALTNCALTGNSASEGGGGAYGGTLNNCTLTGNFSWDTGGGAYQGTLVNCIVYFNTAQSAANYASSTLDYCCTTPMPTNGIGNISTDPQLTSASHLSGFSPCIGKGNYAAVSGADLDGEPWVNPPSIGCDEYYSGAVTGPLSVNIVSSYTSVAVGYLVSLTGLIEGRTDLSFWAFGDGSFHTNEPYAMHSWSAPGDYVVSLWCFNESNPDGVHATAMIHVSEGLYYVDAASPNPTPPYTNWATAATVIQDAVDAAIVGGTVYVTNGMYSTGRPGRPRVMVGRPLTLKSANGPQFTVINGAGAVNCVYLAGGTTLCGFTLTNGFTGYSGGGVVCDWPSAMVSNCVIVGNSAQYGGGASGGTLNNCALIGNSALTGWGGGAIYSTLNSCTLTSNSARQGGGAFVCLLYSCTLAGNTADNGGGGAWGSTLNNCIAYFNTNLRYTAPSYGANYDGCTLNYCCTTPVPTDGFANITNAPLFVDYASGNLRLQSNSPCINSGHNAYVSVATDVDGKPRIVRGTVDIGAYEYQGSGSRISYAWLQHYGLLTDGSADFTDPDGDHYNNWQEWLVGSDPANALSAPPFITAQPVSQVVAVGGAALFSVTAIPPGSELSYQWRFNATNVIPGATNSSLTLPNAQPASDGLYSALVSNVFGSILSSNALLRVDHVPVADASATRSPVISTNGVNATVILDGSRSLDPDGDPLSYTWLSTLNSQPSTLLANGVVATPVLPVGAHPMILVVSDGLFADTNGITVEVITTAQAIERLLALVERRGLRVQALQASLESSLASIQHGNVHSAINQLEAFEKKVRAQVVGPDAALAATLLAAAQAIIDALSQPADREPGQSDVKITSLEHRNGKIRMHMMGISGRPCIVQASTNLVDWEMIGVATEHAGSEFQFEDAGILRSRYYRIVSP